MLVRWLGFWLMPTLNLTPHFTRRLAIAQGVLVKLRQLSPPGLGLLSHLNQKPVQAVILPILTYGADWLIPSVLNMKKLDVFYNKALDGR